MRNKTFFLTLFFFTLLCPSLCPALEQARGIVDLDELRSMPVLDDGRIKPLDTYARNVLLQISGRKSLEGRDAIDWLARLLFVPETTKNDKVFLINNPAIAEALEIPVEAKRRYEFALLQSKFQRLQELASAASAIDEKERDIVENEIIRVYTNLNLYSSLSLVFSFSVPHPDFQITVDHLKNQLNLPPGTVNFSFLDIALKADALQSMAAPLASLPRNQWDREDQQLITVVTNMLKWSLVYKDLPLHLVPSVYEGNSLWFSPWDILSDSLQSPADRKEMAALANIAAAYRDGKQLDFNLAAKAFKSSSQSRLLQNTVSQPKALQNLSLEVFLNRSNPLLIAKICYFFTLLLFLFSLFFDFRWVRTSSTFLLAVGFGLHLVTIACRALILQRPPVSNLYETFVFVGFIGVLAGLLIEKVVKNWVGVVTAGICGFAFLTIAGKFATEGDTLQMLVAVLNSNFWLSTHVLSITIGYAGVCVAGIIGHIYILQSIVKTSNQNLLNSTYRILVGTLGFGLTMTFLGTNLGGIWADQSWGRFWGWDPKENGALMIILWTAILFHAKIARMIGPLGLAAGSILGITVVMWAWFGVNLLGIGLHSYGFTSGLAINLAVYFVLQLAFVAVSVPIAKKRMSKK